MKVIKICSDVTFNDSASFLKEEKDIKNLSFKDFIDVAINGSTRFGQGAKNIRAGMRILDSLENAIKNNLQEFAVETDDWEKLWDAVDTKQWPPRMIIAAEKAGWLAAVEKAEDLKTSSDK